MQHRRALAYPEGRLFVYGTLMFPEVVQGLLDRTVSMLTAKLEGFRRMAIDRGGKGAKGPIVFPADGYLVDGVLLEGISSDEQAMLDYFEEAAGGYLLIKARVTPETGNPVEAGIYEGTQELREMISGEWSPSDFEGAPLKHYVQERIPLLRQRWKAHDQ